MDRFLLPLLTMFMMMAPRPGQGGEPPARQAEVEASFDIAASRVTGTLRFPVSAGETARILAGGLNLSSVTMDGRPVDAPLKDGVLTLAASVTGTVAVGYSAVFKGGNAVGERNYGVVTAPSTAAAFRSRARGIPGRRAPRPGSSWRGCRQGTRRSPRPSQSRKRRRTAASSSRSSSPIRRTACPWSRRTAGK